MTNVVGMIDENAMALGFEWRGQHVDGWHASEKYDGCHVYWDGKSLWTRGGKIVPAPAEFVAQLPRIHLEAELWCGYNSRRESVEAVKHGRFHALTCLKVFDAPQEKGTWFRRLTLAHIALEGCAIAATVRLFPFQNLFGLAEAATQVINYGGEGLVLRCPRTEGHQAGRTHTMLKLKAPQLQQLKSELRIAP